MTTPGTGLANELLRLAFYNRLLYLFRFTPWFILALLLALGNPKVNLIGVTTVGGNQSLGKVTYNARAVLEAAGARDVPVRPRRARKPHT